MMKQISGKRKKVYPLFGRDSNCGIYYFLFRFIFAAKFLPQLRKVISKGES